MGISLNVDVTNENEFNQQLQQYLAQGYKIQSNLNGTAILSKKSYSTGLLIVLVILFFPAAIIYYFLASEDMVTIRNNNGAGNTLTSNTNNNANDNRNNQSFDSYCQNCGQGVYKGTKFCPVCGNELNNNDNGE